VKTLNQNTKQQETMTKIQERPMRMGPKET